MFGQEKVHIAVAPMAGEQLPSYRCGRCERTLPESQFGFMPQPANVGGNLAKKRVSFLHPYCFKCREQIKGKWTQHDLYVPALDSLCHKLTLGAKSGASNRGIVFALSSDDVLGMYLEQRGICAISGLEMDWKAKGGRKRNARNYKGVSIDRIDSAGNYVIGNVHLVMQIVNIMKNDLPTDMFVAMCRQIADHNVSGV